MMGITPQKRLSASGWPPCKLRPEVPWDLPRLGCLSADDCGRVEYFVGKVSSEPLLQGTAMQARPCLYSYLGHTLV